MSHAIAEKDNLIHRAKRIQGQVDAVVRALQEERDCSDILQLMGAVRGAMSGLMAGLLEGHIRSQMPNGKRPPKLQQLGSAQEVIALVKCYLK